MAAMKIEYTLTLTEEEALSLKKILGGMNDDEFAKLGVRGEQRRAISDIWDLLPFEDDE